MRTRARLMWRLAEVAAFRAPKALLTCDRILGADLCPDLQATAGYVHVRGYRLWYTIYESKSNRDPDMLPLINVHGGPSFTHNYLLPLKQIACRGRKVVFYDQIGCGNSDRPSLADAPWLVTEEYYMEELNSLIEHLQFDRYHLLGNSWGGLLVLRHAIKAPEGLVGLVLASATSDTQLYIQSQKEVRHSTIPLITVELIREADEKGTYDTPVYNEINDRLESFWTIRTIPRPDCFLKAVAEANIQIYTAMQGASEFQVSGVLGSYNVTGQLGQIKARTFVTAGAFDTMTPPVISLLQERIPGASLQYFSRSGHLTMIDDAPIYNPAVHNFLCQAEASIASSSALSSFGSHANVWLWVIFLCIAVATLGAIVCAVFRRQQQRYSPIP
eukprot:g37253.t1